MADVYDTVSTGTRKARVTKAVKAASELLAAGRHDLAVEVLFAPKVVRAAQALVEDGHMSVPLVLEADDTLTMGGVKVGDVPPTLAAFIRSGAMRGASIVGTEPSPEELPENDLPGMWSRSDFLGGTDCEHSYFFDADGLPLSAGEVCARCGRGPSGLSLPGILTTRDPWENSRATAGFDHVHDQYGRCWKNRSGAVPCEEQRDRRRHVYDHLMNCQACGHAHVGREDHKDDTECDPRRTR